MARQRRKDLTDEQIAGALRKTGGIKSQAARLLGVPEATFRRWVKESEYLSEVEDAQTENLVDDAEQVIHDILRDREHPKQLTAAIFVLRTKGRSRGWQQGHVVEVEDKRSSQDLSGRTGNELKETRAALEAALATRRQGEQ